MGKASKWFRGLLGLKSTDTNSQKPKKKWTLAKYEKEKNGYNSQHSGAEEDNEASKHAIAVAAATAAVAEAAVAAAQAAAAVVQLTSSGRNISMARSVNASQSGPGYRREEWAAVTIQSHFRAYLSRRALRALKALVKLQALVRGHLVRKQTAYALRRLQALVRAQVRARTGRALNSESPQSSTKSSHFNYPGPATPEKFENAIRARSVNHEQLIMLKRNGSKSSSNIDHNLEKSQARRMLIHDKSGRLSEQGSFPPTHPIEDDKILEVDTGNPHKHRPLFYSSHLSLNSDHICQSFSTSTARQTVLSPAQSSIEVQSYAENEDESAYNTPTYYSVSSRRRAFTPTKSERSCLSNSGYSDHPNYMSYTESSKAKVRRSLSAPKQRPHFERSSSVKRYSVHGATQFTLKAYPGSGRLDRAGMPVKSEVAVARDISEIGLDYPLG